jgi:hypothetical protein
MLSFSCSSNPVEDKVTPLIENIEFFSGSIILGKDYYESKILPVVRACIKRKGYVFIEPTLLIPKQTLTTDSLEFVQTYGLGMSTSYDVRRPNPWLGDDQLVLRSTPQMPEYEKALFGAENLTGCLDEANEKAVGLNAPKTQRLVDDLRAGLIRFEQSNEVRELLQGWRRCISGIGDFSPKPTSINDLRAVIGRDFVRLQSKTIRDSEGRLDEAKLMVAEEELKLIQLREIELATSEFACRDVNYRTYLAARSEALVSFADSK